MAAKGWEDPFQFIPPGRLLMAWVFGLCLFLVTAIFPPVFPVSLLDQHIARLSLLILIGWMLFIAPWVVKLFKSGLALSLSALIFLIAVLVTDGHFDGQKLWEAGLQVVWGL